VFAVAVFCLIIAAGCGAVSTRIETANANKLTEEANAANAEAAKSLEEVNKRFAQLFSGDITLDDRKKLEPTAKDAVESIDKAKAKLNEGISKLDQASKLGIEPWHKEYLSTMAASYRNSDQMADLLKQMAQLYMDYSLDVETLQAKYKELVDKSEKLDKESAEISAKIKNIEDANKDRMKP
jgi:hypothetical protein